MLDDPLVLVLTTKDVCFNFLINHSYKMVSKRTTSTTQLNEQKKRKSTYTELEKYITTDKRFYPNPITPSEANKFNNGKRIRHIHLINQYIASQKYDGSYRTIIHWFRSDLRVTDNKAFSRAIEILEQVKRNNVDCKILALFIINETDWEAHLESEFKLRLLFEALASLKVTLSKLHIPLLVRKYNPDCPSLSNSYRFATWFKDNCHEISPDKSILVTVNAQYENDEACRDLKISKLVDSNFSFLLEHDLCVVEPGRLKTQNQTQYTVFKPWYNKWCSWLENQKLTTTLIKTYNIERRPYNEEKICDIGNSSSQLNGLTAFKNNKRKFMLGEAGEVNAAKILNRFLETKVKQYNNDKDLLYIEGSSHLSGFISLGILSPRIIINEVYRLNNRKLVAPNLRDNNSLENFIKELAWRDFYKHALCNWPYISMDLPFNLSYNDMKWDNNIENFKRWCYGETGIPIVDAIMRKLLSDGYINNRARMITSSFLCKNLLIDWKWGERWFRNHLIDCDLSSNVCGWGYSSSTGIDAQPFFRIFNMTLQSKKYDSQGNFIRKWVKELKNTENVHDPSSTIEGYYAPIVDLKQSRERALEAYRDIQ